MKILRRLLFALTVFCPSIHAADKLFDYLASLPSSQTNTIGKICERITEQAFIDIFSEEPSIQILSNISYTEKTLKKKRNHKILGEADILVLKDGYLWQFVEVKCSNKNNMKKARKKAIAQINRFNAMCVHSECAMWDGKKRIEVKIPKDKSGLEFFAVSYQGAHPDFIQFGETYQQIVDMHNKLKGYHEMPPPLLVRQVGNIKG